MFGFEGAPLLLPKMVPNRIAYLEIIRQLAEASSTHLGAHGKQSLMPGYLCFEEFAVSSTKGYDLIKDKLAYYGLAQDEPRVNFDPEGFMISAKQSQKLRSYEHVPLIHDDLIRNLSEPQAMNKLEAYDKVIRAEEWKKNHNLLELDVHLDIHDPIARIHEKIAHLEKIIEGVPLSVLDRDTRKPLGKDVQIGDSAGKK